MEKIQPRALAPLPHTKPKRWLRLACVVCLLLLLVAGGTYFALAKTYRLLPPEISPGATSSGELTNAQFRRARARYRWASPHAELDRALAAGDERPIGLMGVGLYTPGANLLELASERNSVRIVPHTSDAISSEAHRAYNEAAEQFAQQYNALLQQRLAARE